MTPRAWILLLAAAIVGVLTALFWPDSVEDESLRLDDVTLTDADVELFLAMAQQLETDREALLVDLPEGMGLLRFAAEMSRRPSRLAGSCERGATSPARYLAIVAALGKAQQLDARLTRWDAEVEAREQAADLTARVLDAHGRPAPAEGSGNGEPPWLAAIPPNEQANVEVWRRHAGPVIERWSQLMRADRLR